MSLPISEVKSTSSTGALVESFLSTPEIVSRTIALSLTFLVLDQFGLMKMQKQLNRNVIHVRKLVSYQPPQYAVGCRIEPPVSEPRLNGTKPAATALNHLTNHLVQLYDRMG